MDVNSSLRLGSLVFRTFLRRLQARSHLNELIELGLADRELLLSILAGPVVEDLTIVLELFLALGRLLNDIHGVEDAPSIVDTSTVVLDRPIRIVLLHGVLAIKCSLCSACGSAILPAQRAFMAGLEGLVHDALVVLLSHHIGHLFVSESAF